MKATALGHAGLKGWRSKFADVAAPQVARRSGMSEDQARALIGTLFLILAVLYLVKSIKDLATGSQST